VVDKLEGIDIAEFNGEVLQIIYNIAIDAHYGCGVRIPG
jgi:hypothetical protein